MSAPHSHPENEGESQRIISPFAQTTSSVHSAQAKNPANWSLWIVSSLLILVIAGVAGYFVYKYIEDPYRTLKTFPMDTYLSDYRALSGAKFKADLKVANNLGWKPNTGQLMVFTVENSDQDSGVRENNNRSIVVMIPPKLGGIFFMKGQVYQASLEVGEGGLIYADSCDKE